MKKLFVGNLPWSAGDAELSAMLSDMGFQIKSVKVITDRETGRSRGFAFVEFLDAAEAERAVSELTGALMDGRTLFASEARKKETDGNSQEPRQEPRPASPASDNRGNQGGRGFDSNLPGRGYQPVRGYQAGRPNQDARAAQTGRRIQTGVGSQDALVAHEDAFERTCETPWRDDGGRQYDSRRGRRG